MKGEKELVMDEGIDKRGQKREGGSAEILVLCDSDFSVGSVAEMTY